MEKKHSQILNLSKPYLTEARKRIFRCLIFFLAIFLFSFSFSEKIIKFFLGMFKFEDVQIVTTSPFQFFGLAINMAISMAIIATFPMVIYNIFSFLSPALTKKEKRVFVKIVFLSIFFFAGGFLFGFNILNYILIMLAGYNSKIGLINMWDVGIFSSQIFLTATFMGIIFQFPIILSIFIKKEFISVEVLRKKRKWAILSSFIIAALLPPTDGLSLIVMASFFIVIFEITLLYNRKVILKKEQA